MNNFLKYSLIYIILIIFFIGALVISSSFSSDKIFDNVKASADVLLNEGNRKIIYIPYRKINMQFDNYTDALMINTAYSIDNSTPLYSALVARKNFISGVTDEIYQDSMGELKSSSKYKYHNEVGELNDLVNGEKAESFEYARYWHGYLIILRPLLLIFNINNIRLILTIILILLAIVLGILIYKKIDLITSIIFLLGLLGGEYFYLGYSLQGIFVFLIAMISSIVLLSRFEKIKNFGILFFITGIFTNFFDFLTVPLITLVVPMAIYFLLEKEKMNIKMILRSIIINSLLWGIGYGLTWFTKWILIDIIYNKNIVSVALKQVLYRSSAGSKGYNILKVINENQKYILIPMFITVLITIFLNSIRIILFNVKYHKSVEGKKILKETLPYIIIAIFPFCWYTVLQNHSYYHAFFTYRNLIITNICINIIIDKILKEFFKTEKIENKTDKDYI